MKKIILIGFCVFGLEITEAISENGIAKLKHLAYEEPLNAINMSAGNSMPIATEIDRIIDFGKTFLDKPYKYKGPCSWVMDCSGYIACIFSEFGYQMPHSTPSIASIVKDVNLTEVQKGDLLFFKGRDNNSNSVGHVSIVTEVTNGNIKMMHSCNRGIVIDEYQKMDYYKTRLIKAGRLPFVYESKLNTLEVSKQDSISIIGVGDMMLGTNFPSVSYLPPEDGKNILTPVKHILKNADITFGNLESVILSEGGTVKRCSNPDLCYAFRMPNHYVNYFKEAGFDVLSLANNHIGDFGTKG
ncbi:MAG: CapA family protein, partial [Flavobacteriales bacterium]